MDNSFKSGSIRAKIYLLALFVFIFFIVGALQNYLDRIVYRAEGTYFRAVKLEKTFSKTLSGENAALHAPSVDDLLQEYQDVRGSCRECHSQATDSLIAVRQRLFAHLYQVNKDILALNTDIHSRPIDLLGSVKYIHSHHIAYMKNIVRRGSLSQDYDVGAHFEKSPVKSAPELDIIQVSVSVSAQLFDVFDCFYQLEQRRDPATVKEQFGGRILKFYQFVNMFEDYSLDAQDGLLVEELLMSGRKFEAAFKDLQEMEKENTSLVKALEANKENTYAMFGAMSGRIQQANKNVKRDIQVLTLISLVVTLLLVSWIVLSGRQIIREIRRTVKETQKIQNDLDYQIDLDDCTFKEFKIVFGTLNLMANKINHHLKALTTAHDYLELRVEERTADLSKANELLKLEISERRHAQGLLAMARDELEKRVAQRTAELAKSNRKLRGENAERQKAEAQLKRAKEIAESANRAKSDFLANMSHELRTPLNHIIGFTSLVVEKNFGDLNEAQEEYLTDVLDSSRHLLSLINDILDLAKVEANKLDLEISEMYLKDVLSQSLVMIKEKALKHGIRLLENFEGAPEIIQADERKLKQVLYNLLSNAAKFTPDGGSIDLSAQHICFAGGRRTSWKGDPLCLPFDHDGDSFEGKEFLHVSVVDCGIGVPSHELQRIFDPFEQVDQSLIKRNQGTGLGLALTTQLIELHGGRIWAESKGEGCGCTFCFIIPLQAEPHEPVRKNLQYPSAA